MDAISGLPAALVNAAAIVNDSKETDPAGKVDAKSFIKALAKLMAGKNKNLLNSAGGAGMLPGLSAIGGSQEGSSSSDLGGLDLSGLTQKISMLLKR